MTRQQELLQYPRGLNVSLRLLPHLSRVIKEEIISHGHTDIDREILWDRIESMPQEEYDKFFRDTKTSDKIQNMFSGLSLADTMDKLEGFRAKTQTPKN